MLKGLPASLRSTPRTWQAALFLCLAAFILYRPALNRVFVLDQIWYFAERGGDTTLTEGLRHYDYAATRRYWKGDDALFRPLLFVWLAIGDRLFSYHHVWWNAASLALHALVGLFLFRLLVTIRPSPFALAAALLFVVLKPPLELVLWNHLGGYLLASLCLTIALRAFVVTVGADGRPPPGATAAFVLAFTAADLFYEAMVPVSLVAALLVIWTEWRRGARPSIGRTLALLLPVVVFSILYFVHSQRVERLLYVDRPDVQGIFDYRNVMSAVPRSLEVMWRWVAEVTLPSALTFFPRAFNRLAKTFAFSWQSPLHLFNAVLILAALLVFGASLSWRHIRRTSPLLLLLFSAVFAYTAVICLGRPQAEVLATTYYLYIFCLLLAATLYSVVDFDRLQGRTAAAAGVVVAALIVLHAAESLAVTRAIGRANQRASNYFTRVSRFVDSHKAEPGFSFAIVTEPEELDPPVTLIQGYPDRPTSVEIRRSTEIVFMPYYDSAKPKYVLGQVSF